ncbi:unnamed protein product [Phytomonas sp. EM1]|nr:unnamed protein product [Phytomonas sp. EM1]|eukprot:CCW64752.1 unnamed protein product [Phytomonas sp. isolate EM1]
MNKPLGDDNTTVFWHLSKCLQGPLVVLHHSLSHLTSGEVANAVASGITLELLCLDGRPLTSSVDEKKDFLNTMGCEISTSLTGNMHCRYSSTPLSSSDDRWMREDGQKEVLEVSSDFWRRESIITNLSFFSPLSTASSVVRSLSKGGAQHLAVRCQIILMGSLGSATEWSGVEENDPLTSSFEKKDPITSAGARIECSEGGSGGIRSWNDDSNQIASSTPGALLMSAWNAMRTPCPLPHSYFFTYTPSLVFSSESDIATHPDRAETKTAAGLEGTGDEEQPVVMPLEAVASPAKPSERVGMNPTEETTTQEIRIVYVQLAPPISAACLSHLFRQFHTPLLSTDAQYRGMLPGEEALFGSDPVNPDEFVSTNGLHQGEAPYRIRYAPAKSFHGETDCRSDKSCRDGMLESGIGREGEENEMEEVGLRKSDLEALACLFPAVHHGCVFDDSNAFVGHCQDVQDHLLWCEHLPLFPLQVVSEDSPPLPPFSSNASLSGGFREDLIARRHDASACFSSDARREVSSNLEMTWLHSAGEIGERFLNYALGKALDDLDKRNSTTTTLQVPLRTVHSRLLHWFTLLYDELDGLDGGSKGKRIGEAFSFSNISCSEEKAERKDSSRAPPKWVCFLTALRVAGRIARRLSTTAAPTPAEEMTSADKEMRRMPCGASLPCESSPFVDWTSLSSVSEFVFWSVEDYWASLFAPVTARLPEMVIPEDAVRQICTGCECVNRHPNADKYQCACLTRSFEGLFCRSVHTWLSSGDVVSTMPLLSRQGADCTLQTKAHNTSNAFRCNKKVRIEPFLQDDHKRATADRSSEESGKNGIKLVAQRLAAALAVPLAFVITKYMRRKEVESRLLHLSKRCGGVRKSTSADAFSNTDDDRSAASVCSTPSPQKNRIGEEQTPIDYRSLSSSDTHVGKPGGEIVAKNFFSSGPAHCTHLTEATDNQKTSFFSEGHHFPKERSCSITTASYESNVGDEGGIQQCAKSNEEEEEAANHHQRFMDLLLLLFLNPTTNTLGVPSTQ